jgi:hypothetical protein
MVLLAYNLLIYVYDIKSLMIPISWTILIGLILVFVIKLPLAINLVAAQPEIITLPGENNETRLILNMDNLTQTLVNATTNETISVENFTLYRPNGTTNETLTTIPENATINETLTTIPENATINETLTTIPENATTNDNLTAKFKELQGN